MEFRQVPQSARQCSETHTRYAKDGEGWRMWYPSILCVSYAYLMRTVSYAYHKSHMGADVQCAFKRFSRFPMNLHESSCIVNGWLFGAVRMLHHRVQSFNFLTFRFRLDKWWLLALAQQVVAREYGRIHAGSVQRWRCSKGLGIQHVFKSNQNWIKTQGHRRYVWFHSSQGFFGVPPLRASCNRGATCDYVCNRLTEAINNRKPPWSALFTVPLPVWHERDVERFRAKWSKNHANDPRNATNFQILGPIVNLAVLTKSHCLALGSEFRCFCVAHWCPWWWHAQQTFQPPKCVSWLIAQHKVSTALQSNST